MKTITYDETKYVLVPVEPTPQMIRAMIPGSTIRNGYKAMLSAAPKTNEVEK